MSIVRVDAIEDERHERIVAIGIAELERHAPAVEVGSSDGNRVDAVAQFVGRVCGCLEGAAVVGLRSRHRLAGRWQVIRRVRHQELEVRDVVRRAENRSLIPSRLVNCVTGRRNNSRSAALSL